MNYLLGLFLVGNLAFAHPLDMGLLEINAAEKEVKVKLGLHPSAVGPEFLKTFTAEPLVKANGETCAWRMDSARLEPVDAQNVAIFAEATCPTVPATLGVSAPFLGSWVSTFRLLVVAKWGGRERVATLDPSHPEATLDAGKEEGGFWKFVVMGIEHIGAAPSEWRGPEGFRFPEGLDHILFVIALILAGGTFLQLFQIVTGFTLGHSVTLALGALGLFHLPSRLVESLIALSIAAVAAEVWFPKFHRHRWKIAAFFGLVHGMGFASALAELRFENGGILKALFGFNVGVEIGQAIIVAVVLPLLLLLKKKDVVYRGVTRGLSAAIFIAGMFWFLQRALGWE